MYPLLAIISLAFLIVVHEGGHYFVARWCRMRIERFSLGFGPGILKRKSKKTGTVFQIAPIPFGGFVEIRGMNIAEDVDPTDRFAYPNRPAWQRFVTIFAGPATNYLSAIVLCFFLYTCHGTDSPWRWYGIDSVAEQSPAFGKLEAGDRILEVDHVKVVAQGTYTDATGTYTDAKKLTELVNEKQGAPVTLTVLRHDKRLEITITPAYIAGLSQHMSMLLDARLRECCHVRLAHLATPRYILGIALREEADGVPQGFFAAAGLALEYPIEKTQEIASGLYGILTGAEKADPAGVVRISEELEKAWKLGSVTGIKLLMLLNVYLGLFNLFPLPALDGGRLVFLVYEMVTRRRANPKIEATVHMAGIMVLGVVMILVTLRDVVHVFN
jgi:regulator of sigma E protease